MADEVPLMNGNPSSDMTGSHIRSSHSVQGSYAESDTVGGQDPDDMIVSKFSPDRAAPPPNHLTNFHGDQIRPAPSYPNESHMHAGTSNGNGTIGLAIQTGNHSMRQSIGSQSSLHSAEGTYPQTPIGGPSSAGPHGHSQSNAARHSPVQQQHHIQQQLAHQQRLPTNQYPFSNNSPPQQMHGIQGRNGSVDYPPQQQAHPMNGYAPPTSPVDHYPRSYPMQNHHNQNQQGQAGMHYADQAYTDAIALQNLEMHQTTSADHQYHNALMQELG